MEDRLIKKLITSMKCGVCGQSYGTGNINILGHHDDLWFLKVLCSACQTQYLVAAVIKAGKTPEVITDLTEAEEDRFRHIRPVTADDVLNMHKLLKDFNGDCSRLLGLKQAGC